MSAQPRLTAEQYLQVERLRSEHGLGLSEITFLSSGQPWLNSKTRLRLARNDSSFDSIDSTYQGRLHDQIVHYTTVTRNGKTFTMPGVAAIGEKLWNGEAADANELSLARLIANACDAAGYNPLGRTRAVEIDTEREESDATDEAAETVQRLKDLKRIHVVAKTVGLIVNGNERLYREFLKLHYQTTTSMAMDRDQRQLLINKLLTAGPAFVREHLIDSLKFVRPAEVRQTNGDLDHMDSLKG